MFYGEGVIIKFSCVTSRSGKTLEAVVRRRNSEVFEKVERGWEERECLT
jgi:hypothetical protein